MEKFSDRLSMERIASAAYSLAGVAPSSLSGRVPTPETKVNIFELHQKLTGHLFPAYSNTDERFLGLALAGETGELCNMIKKRWRDGVDLTEPIRDEIADIRVYLELIAKCFGIEGEKLDQRVEAKLVQVAEKHKDRLTRATPLTEDRPQPEQCPLCGSLDRKRRKIIGTPLENFRCFHVWHDGEAEVRPVLEAGPKSVAEVEGRGTLAGSEQGQSGRGVDVRQNLHPSLPSSPLRNERPSAASPTPPESVQREREEFEKWMCNRYEI